MKQPKDYVSYDEPWMYAEYDESNDYCTMWPETIYGRSIKFCCYIHDETYSTSKFYNCLSTRIGIFTAAFIAAGGWVGVACKYPKIAWRRLGWTKKK